MKFVKLKHYYPDDRVYTFYVITMSDGLDYISCGDQFAEATPTNIATIIYEEDGYDIDIKFEVLFNSRSRALDEITDAYCMFAGSKITEFTEDMPNVIDASYMFDECDELKIFKSYMPKLVKDQYMFDYCPNLKVNELSR